MKLSDHKVDAAAVEQGEWVGNIPDFADIRLKVRGINNAHYRRLYMKLRNAVPRSRRDDPLVMYDLQPQLLHETILLDWENVEEGPYSKELAWKYLSEPDWQEFRDAVTWAANMVGKNITDDLETDVKN
jgi:hypothetical protein